MKIKRFLSIHLCIAAALIQAQTFYQSGGLELFNQGNNVAALDSMRQWAETHSAEKGLALYYMGESAYRIALETQVRRASVDRFKESLRYFQSAVLQPDMQAQHPDLARGALYKQAWSQYRIVEIESDPAVLEASAKTFADLARTGSDSLVMLARYMAADTRLRLAIHRYGELVQSNNSGQIQNQARDILNWLDGASRDFQTVQQSSQTELFLQSCARFGSIQTLLVKVKLYLALPEDVFSNISDPMKSGSSLETVKRILKSVDFRTVMTGNAAASKELRPLLAYGTSIKALETAMLSEQDPKVWLDLDASLDTLRLFPQFLDDVNFMRGARQFGRAVPEDAQDLSFAENQASLNKAAGRIPEAWYWLGWMRALVGDTAGQGADFRRFIESTRNETDPRLRYLADDAQYRLFYLRFQSILNSSGSKGFNGLISDLNAFQPKAPVLSQQKASLLNHVRSFVMPVQQIWPELVRENFDESIRMIRRQLEFAQSVTGKPRAQCLSNLNKLFLITTAQRLDETRFYRGIALYLEAEIQASHAAKLKFYQQAADTLALITGHPRLGFEARYIRGKCYFSMAAHERDDIGRRKDEDKAREFFYLLIKDQKSLRSLCHLADILYQQENYLAAQRCYETVMQKTQNQPGGTYWYRRAAAGLTLCQGRQTGDSGLFRELNPSDVVFPEWLIPGERFCFEQLADLDYVLDQSRLEALHLFQRFSMPMRMLYPSSHAPVQSTFAEHAFGAVTAGLNERLGAIASGLRLVLVLPEDVPNEPLVKLENTPLEKNSDGTFQRSPIAFNQTLNIHVENEGCFPQIWVQRFSQPHLESITVFLKRRVIFERTGKIRDVKSDPFSGRIDRNLIMNVREGLETNSTLNRDLMRDVHIRDLAYSPILDRWLVVRSDATRTLSLYTHDSAANRAGELPLVFSSPDSLLSPEGIAVDSRGTIYIADWGNHRIIVFDANGAFLSVIGVFGRNNPYEIAEPLRLVYPTRIALAEDNAPVAARVQNPDRILFVSDWNGVYFADMNGYYLGSVDVPDATKNSLWGMTTTGYLPEIGLDIANRTTQKIESFQSKPIPILPKKGR